jgi:hypothetical protein
MIQNNIEQEKPWCIFGIGELGKMFCNNFEDKLRGQCKCCLVDNLAELQAYCASDAHSEDAFWMLIAEYEQDIWEKFLESDGIKKLMHEISVKFIIIHPKNNSVTTTERQFIRLMDHGKVVFAMPEMARKLLMEKCVCLYMISLQHAVCQVMWELNMVICSVLGVTTIGMVWFMKQTAHTADR